MKSEKEDKFAGGNNIIVDIEIVTRVSRTSKFRKTHFAQFNLHQPLAFIACGRPLKQVDYP